MGRGKQLGKKKSEKAIYETIIKMEKHCSRSGADKPCLQRAKTVKYVWLVKLGSRSQTLVKTVGKVSQLAFSDFIVHIGVCSYKVRNSPQISSKKKDKMFVVRGQTIKFVNLLQ